MSLTPCQTKIFDRYNIDDTDRAELSQEIDNTLAAYNYSIERAMTTPDGRKLLKVAVDSALTKAKKDQSGLLATIKQQHPDLFGKGAAKAVEPVKAAQDLAAALMEKADKGKQTVYSLKSEKQVHLFDYQLQAQTEDVVLLAQSVQPLLERAMAIKADLADKAIENVNESLAKAAKMANLAFDKDKGAATFQTTQMGKRVDVPVTLAVVAQLRTNLVRAVDDLAKAIAAVPPEQARAALRQTNQRTAALMEKRRAKEAAEEATATTKSEAQNYAEAAQGQQEAITGELDTAEAENAAVNQEEQGKLAVKLEKSEVELKDEAARKAEEKETKRSAKEIAKELETPALETKKARKQRQMAERVAKAEARGQTSGEVKTVAPETVEVSAKGQQKAAAEQQKAAVKEEAKAAPPKASTSVQMIAQRNNIDLAQVTGTGENGAVTTKDLVMFMNNRKAQQMADAAEAAKAAPAPEPAAAPTPEPTPAEPQAEAPAEPAAPPKAPKKKTDLGRWASQAAKDYAASRGKPVTEEEIPVGTGKGGKIVKADVELALDKRRWAAERADFLEAMGPKKPAIPPAEHAARTEALTEARKDIRAHAAAVAQRADRLGPYSADILMERMLTSQTLTAAFSLEPDETMSADLAMELLLEQLDPHDPYVQLIKEMQQRQFGDFEVAFVDREYMYEQVKEYAGGAYLSGKLPSKNGQRRPYRVILLNNDLANDRALVKTLMHELVHAATSQGLLFDNELAQRMEVLRLAVIKELERRNDKEGLGSYGLKNVDEFVAEAMTSKNFQALLSTIFLEGNQKRSVWREFLTAISRFLGFGVDESSVLAEVVSLTPKMFLSDAEALQGITKANKFDYIANVTDQEQWKKENTPTEAEMTDWMRGSPMPEGRNPRGPNEAQMQARLMSSSYGKSAGQLADAALGQFSNRLDRSTLRNFGRRVMLGMHTLDQLVRHYTKLFTDGSLGRYADIVRSKNSMARAQQIRAEELQKTWRDLERKDAAQALRTAQLMHDTTLEEIHPDVGLSDPRNAHLWKTSKLNGKQLKNPNTQAVYDRLHAEYMGLGREYQELYHDVREFYGNQRRKLREETMRNTGRVHNLDKLFSPAEFLKFVEAETVADIHTLVQSIPDVATRKEIIDIAARVLHTTSVKGPYFPLRRFGEYVVEAIKEHTQQYATLKEAREAAKAYRQLAPTNKAIVDQATNAVRFEDRIVEMFETEQDAQEAATKYNDQGYLGRDKDPIFVTLKSDWKAPPDSSAHVLLTQARKKFADTPTVLKALDTAFLEILLENSVKKSELTRRKVKGATVTDMRRAFAERAYAGSWAIADVATAFDHATALRDMEKAHRAGRENAIPMGDVLKEIRMRDERSLADRKVTGLDRALANVGFVWYLASPSYAAVNMTQPLLVGMPYLQAKYGFHAAGELMKSYKGLFRAGMKELKDLKFGWKGAPENLIDTIGKQLTPAERKMIDELTRLGIIDSTFARELFNASQGRADTATSRGAERAMNMARSLPQVVEVINRVVMARAAYTLATRKGASREEATKAAAEAVLETQFDYSDQNKPRYFKGWPGARAIMMFKMYAQGIYALLIGNTAKALRGATKQERAEGRKLLAGVMASHSLAAGVLGGVLMEPLRWVLNAILWATGDDDEPFDLDVEVQNMLTDMFGASAAEVISRGLPRAAGFDLSSRVGLNNLMFMDGPEARSFEEAWQQKVIGLLGPLGALSMRGARGMDYWHKGEYAKAIENTTPKFMRDLTRAWRVSTEGMTDYNGNRIAKPEQFGPLDAMYQALGFQPAEMAQTYEGRAAQSEFQTALNDRRKLLMQEWRRADNRDEFFQEEIRAFNRTNPEFRIRPADLYKSLREQRRRERDTVAGAYVEREKKSVRNQARFVEP